ncbi:TetR/AcrR family transcriptional regulator [Streptomyces fulvoviolaceus]|uniref:TetR/AcrR family transcriptional regulator n=1 Tax=Streptomyces fulvoviolaceus TaxID=285535 RepID=UPI0004CC6484|nr:TetR/AcrR family transcriptional regulator [Streptomyces fulvoviolaceus]MCT9075481.1 TetR/AcrR family transcriptional regulator [Streptomyces fulvoviolaceus]
MAQVNEVSSTTASGARRRNPRGQGERLRQEVLAAVGRLLDQKVGGEDALPVSLREVAREVGIAAQSMYLHFSDKEQLARAVAEDGYRRIVAAMRSADAAASLESAGAAERLRAQSDAFCDFARANRGVFRLMFGNDLSHLGAPGETPPGRILWEQWLAAVGACEDEGVHWPDGVHDTTMHLWAALFGRFALWAGSFGEHDPETLHTFAHRTIDMLLRDARG